MELIMRQIALDTDIIMDIRDHDNYIHREENLFFHILLQSVLNITLTLLGLRKPAYQ
jgi:hypothetical protein